MSGPGDKPKGIRWFKPSQKNILVGVILLIVIVALAVAGLLIWRDHHKRNLNDVKTVTSLVSKHYVLPSNETPALATVTDSSKVQSNFAAKLKNDDKLLIYENNKKVIVYRPSIDRIIDVEPVTVSAPSSSSSSASSTSAIPDINPFGDGQ